MMICHRLIWPREESRKRRAGFDQEIYSETTYYGKLCLHGAFTIYTLVLVVYL